jgi:hypothetical protein
MDEIKTRCSSHGCWTDTLRRAEPLIECSGRVVRTRRPRTPPAQPLATHELGDRAAGHPVALPLALLPDLLRPVHPAVRPPDPFDLGPERRFPLGPGRQPAGVGLPALLRGSPRLRRSRGGRRGTPPSRPAAVELRLDKIGRGLAQDLIRPAQLAVLPLELFDALLLRTTPDQLARSLSPQGCPPGSVATPLRLQPG